MAWFLAPTLVQLRSEVNRRWPIRDKTSDGTLGNAAHQAGTSDHNPDSRGCVCAIDFDEDLTLPAAQYPSFRPGDGARPLVRELLSLARAGMLPQLRYIISEGHIWSSTYGFKEQDYFGSNPHDHHAHVSVSHAASLADRTITWGIQVAISSTDVNKIANAVEAKLTGSQAFRRAVADELLDRDAIPNWVNPEENENLRVGNAINLIGKQTK